jgi:cytosine/adenosine deaminase-related metal-dependent hydrolase
MANIRAKLIWSPQSNLLCSGKTTNIAQASRDGVLPSLGVDWNLTGSDIIFDELGVAVRVDKEQFGGIISDWVKLITINPARALALEDHIGRLAPGLKADITAIRSNDSDANQSLLEIHLQDVEMVWVGGELC